MITIQNISVGTKFCQPELVHPHNQMMTVTGIKYNRTFATIEAVGSITGEKKGYAVQSEDSDLSDWLTFCSPEERIERIYQNRREEVIRVAHRNLAEIVQKLQDIRNYPGQLNKDQNMKNLIEYVAKAMIEVF